MVIRRCVRKLLAKNSVTRHEIHSSLKLLQCFFWCSSYRERMINKKILIEHIHENFH